MFRFKKKLNQTHSDSPILITGDGAYGGLSNRLFLQKNGLHYLFKIKSKSKALFNILERRQKIRTEHDYRKEKGCVIDVKIQTFRVKDNAQGIVFYIYIEKSIENLATKKTTTCETHLISNVPQAIDFYQAKLTHWQVESYHKQKDTWLMEDDYHKGNQQAKVSSMMNDLILNLLGQFKIETKSQFKVFQGRLEKILTRFLFDFIFNCFFS